MMRSEIDRRAKRYAARQCVADHGMHKDAPPRKTRRESTKTSQLKAELERWLAANVLPPKEA
jgi:hypothetical protein